MRPKVEHNCVACGRRRYRRDMVEVIPYFNGGLRCEPRCDGYDVEPALYPGQQADEDRLFDERQAVGPAKWRMRRAF